VILGLVVADLFGWRVVRLMGVTSQPMPGAAGFALFVAKVQPALLQALVATYGPVDGREATVDALSWAWEHWDRVVGMDHPTGYLYRVGQSSTRNFLSKPPPVGLLDLLEASFPHFEPGLMPALGRLSPQQRTVVVLVHGFEWRQSEVAELLEISPSTVREHLERAMERLRNELEVHDVGRY
jgi:DNA-directed RNA polymerase specialized sigma24 family protein